MKALLRGQVSLASTPKSQKQRGLQDFSAKLEVHGYLSINTDRELALYRSYLCIKRWSYGHSI